MNGGSHSCEVGMCRDVIGRCTDCDTRVNYRESDFNVRKDKTRMKGQEGTCWSGPGRPLRNPRA